MTLLSLFLTSQISLASPAFQKVELSKINCGSKALSLLQEWGVQDEWRQKFTEQMDEKKFQAPTSQIGKWVQVQYKGKENLKLIEFSEKSTVQIEFTPDCQTKAVAQSPEAGKNSKADSKNSFTYFTDNELEKILKSGKPAAIFMWTPHMQVSIEALKEIRKATEKMKVPLYAVIDPLSNPAAAEKIIRELKFAKSQVYFFDSFELTLRDFRLHYPSLIVINKGQFASPVQRGLETASVYEDYIRVRL